jgi:FixJ family two-component response regulator
MPAPRVRTVAVIDDDRRVPKSFANLLASGGYGTRAYESALDFFSDGYSGLICVITDLGMRPIRREPNRRAVLEPVRGGY